MASVKPKLNGEPGLLQNIGKNQWAYNEQCCDCGLNHHFHFWIYKGELWCKAYRDDYATYVTRKRKKR